VDFEYSDKVKEMQGRVRAFMAEHVYPNHRLYEEQAATNYPPPILDELKAKARAEGLWNMFLPGLKPDEPGTRLSNMEYAPLAEIMGRVMWSSEVFNCSAPDTGNMEVLHMFGTPEQQERWLKPLMNGEIRSCFAMTEPDVASSDATNIRTRIERRGDKYVINGRKWFSSGAADPRCKISILMGVTDPDAEPYRRQSMILVPFDTPGVEVIRNVAVMNRLDHHGHCEVVYRNVEVPATNLIAGEGDGFMIAQARLGPGRIHHCMRSIGQSEVAVELMSQRALQRQTFGQRLADHGVVADWIAQSRLEIEQARLLVLRAAWAMDTSGNKAARSDVQMIKVVVPRMQVAIADRAMQTFGAAGLTPDTPLAEIWTWGRVLRLADGPDEVHIRTIARQEIKKAERMQNEGVPPYWPPTAGA